MSHQADMTEIRDDVFRWDKKFGQGPTRLSLTKETINRSFLLTCSQSYELTTKFLRSDTEEDQYCPKAKPIPNHSSHHVQKMTEMGTDDVVRVDKKLG